MSQKKWCNFKKSCYHGNHNLYKLLYTVIKILFHALDSIEIKFKIKNLILRHKTV